MSESGIVFSIERCSLHDGPGIRTSVFLKGCPLRCSWCHNPESQSFRPQLAFFRDRCVGCGRCAAACQRGVHQLSSESHRLEHSRCTGCGHCAASCPADALRIYGETMAVAQVMDIVERDRAYYEQGGGGITLTGGEPLSQPAFARALLRACRASGIHTCVETSGYAPWSAFEAILPYTQLFLFDYKETDPQRHRTFTGVDNALILKNLDALYRAGKAIQLRCPLIPGYNDTPAHFAGIAALEQRYPGLAGIQIMPYHDLGKSKAAAIGAEYSVAASNVDEAVKTRWREQLQQQGCSGQVSSSF